MSEIKQINTGVAELLVVKVKYGGNIDSFRVRNEVLFMCSRFQFIDAFKIPKGDWTILGLSNELSQQQLDDILPFTNAKWQDDLNGSYLILKRLS